MFRGVINGIKSGNDNRKIFVIGLAGMNIFYSTPSNSKFGLKGEFPVIEDKIAEGQPCEVVHQVNRIGADRVDAAGYINGRGKNMIFSADNELMVDHPVK